MMKDESYKWPPFKQADINGVTEPLAATKPIISSEPRARVRTQVDGLQHAYSVATGIDARDEKTMARQEQADEADADKILSRYGLGAITKQPIYTESNTDLGLQEALFAVEYAKDAWRKMPAELKDRFGNWAELMTAIDRGEVKFSPEKPEPEVKPENPGLKTEPPKD